MATIDATQDYDFISTLTFASASGTCLIYLYRGGSRISGTLYYRTGTSGSWTSLSVSGTGTTFPVSSTTMQVASDWNKSGNNYMTQSFNGQSSNLTEIAISQKAVLSGVIGEYFMLGYANGCLSLTSLAIPDTSSVSSVGASFMLNYALNCSSLERLELGAIGWFASNNVDWSVPSGRLNNLKGYVQNSADLSDWQGEVSSGETLYTNYVRSTSDVVLEIPSTNNSNFLAFMQ